MHKSFGLALAQRIYRIFLFLIKVTPLLSCISFVQNSPCFSYFQFLFSKSENCIVLGHSFHDATFAKRWFSCWYVFSAKVRVTPATFFWFGDYLISIDDHFFCLKFFLCFLILFSILVVFLCHIWAWSGSINTDDFRCSGTMFIDISGKIIR